MAPGRNEPCPCGSGRKYKKCCGAPGRSTTTERVFVTNIGSAPGVPDGVDGWAVEKAYVPVDEAWRATGIGTAGVVRRDGDARLHSAFFWIDLHESGLVGIFGKRDMTERDHERFVKKILPDVPPCVEGPVELASAYIWGARALTESSGAGFPAELQEAHFALVPRPAGSASAWKRRLVGRGGLAPDDLVRMTTRNPVPADMPDGKDIIIITEMTFDVQDHEGAIRLLRDERPEFRLVGEEDGEAEFVRTRPYGKGHWSPLALHGGRQTTGEILVGPSGLKASANTLSMAASLAGKLKQILGERITLRSTTWTDQEELLGGNRDRSVRPDIAGKSRHRGRSR
jgi:hypothetical protein